MTQDEIIRMAREVKLPHWYHNGEPVNVELLERFAALVAAHEREKHNSPSWETVDDAIAAEREACAKVADGELMNTNVLTSYPPKSSAAWNIAAAIRARGEK